MKTEVVNAECLNCGLHDEREVPLDDGSYAQTANDECARCGSHDVRTLPDPEDDERTTDARR